MLLQSAASIVDQFLLSGLNFGIGLALIRFTSKEEYGAYSQLFAAGLLASSLLEAFLGTTLTTLASKADPSVRTHLIRVALKLQLYLSSAFGLIFGLACAIAFSILDFHHIPPIEMGLTFGLYIGTLTLREFFRTTLFLQARAPDVLRLDLGFAVVAAAGGAALIWLQIINIPRILLLMGLSNLFSGGREMWQRIRTPVPEGNAAIRSLMQQLWPYSRWAVPGALIGWAGNYSYLFMATLFLSLSAAADLNASRLLLMPISLSAVAWSRVARPTAGGLIGKRDWAGLKRLTLRSVSGMQVVTWGYVLVLALSFQWLVSHILGAKYANVQPLLLMWGLYFALYAIRMIGTTWLACFGDFQDLFWMGLSALLVQWLTAVFLMPLWGVMGAIAALALVEFLVLSLTWVYLLPRAQRMERMVASAS